MPLGLFGQTSSDDDQRRWVGLANAMRWRDRLADVVGEAQQRAQALTAELGQSIPDTLAAVQREAEQRRDQLQRQLQDTWAASWGQVGRQIPEGIERREITPAGPAAAPVPRQLLSRGEDLTAVGRGLQQAVLPAAAAAGELVQGLQEGDVGQAVRGAGTGLLETANLPFTAAGHVAEQLAREAGYGPMAATALRYGTEALQPAGLAEQGIELGRLGVRAAEAAPGLVRRAGAAVGEAAGRTVERVGEALQRAVPEEAYRLGAVAGEAPSAGVTGGAAVPPPLLELERLAQGAGTAADALAERLSVRGRGWLSRQQQGLLWGGRLDQAVERTEDLTRIAQADLADLRQGGDGILKPDRAPEVVHELRQLRTQLLTEHEAAQGRGAYPVPVRSGEAGTDLVTPGEETAPVTIGRLTGRAGVRGSPEELTALAAQRVAAGPDAGTARGLAAERNSAAAPTALRDALVNGNHTPQWLVDRADLTPEEADVVFRHLGVPVPWASAAESLGVASPATDTFGPRTPTERRAANVGMIAGAVAGVSGETPEQRERGGPTPVERLAGGLIGAGVGHAGGMGAARLGAAGARILRPPTGIPASTLGQVWRQAVSEGAALEGSLGIRRGQPPAAQMELFGPAPVVQTEMELGDTTAGPSLAAQAKEAATRLQQLAQQRATLRQQGWATGDLDQMVERLQGQFRERFGMAPPTLPEAAPPPRHPLGGMFGETLGVTTAEPPAALAREVVSPTVTDAGAPSDPNLRYQFRLKVVPLDDLTASQLDNLTPNPAYPAELQPRQRQRAASAMQVNAIAARLRPEEVLRDVGALDRGPMIVGADNVVESGNGRVLALRRARADYPEQWQGYQRELQAAVRDAGLDPEAVAAIPDPVLVRERVTPVEDRASFAASANEAAVLGMAPTELAQQDARRLPDAAVLRLAPTQARTLDEALTAAANQPLRANFIDALPANERAALVDPSGALSKQGLARLKAALFAKTYPGDAGNRLLANYVEAADPDLRSVGSALEQSLPAMARAEALIAAGQREAGLSLADDIAAAADLLVRLRAQGIPVARYLGQEALFGQELSPLQQQLLRHLDDVIRARRPARLAELLTAYAQEVEANPPPAQLTLGGLERPTTSKAAVLDRLVAQQRETLGAEPLPLFRDSETPTAAVTPEGAQETAQAPTAPDRRAAAAQEQALLQAVEAHAAQVPNPRDFERRAEFDAAYAAHTAEAERLGAELQAFRRETMRANAEAIRAGAEAAPAAAAPQQLETVAAAAPAAGATLPAAPRFIVSNQGMKPGSWKIVDTTTGEAVQSGLHVKTVALQIADGYNQRGRPDISGAVSRASEPPTIPAPLAQQRSRFASFLSRATDDLTQQGKRAKAGDVLHAVLTEILQDYDDVGAAAEDAAILRQAGNIRSTRGGHEVNAATVEDAIKAARRNLKQSPIPETRPAEPVAPEAPPSVGTAPVFRQGQTVYDPQGEAFQVATPPKPGGRVWLEQDGTLIKSVAPEELSATPPAQPPPPKPPTAEGAPGAETSPLVGREETTAIARRRYAEALTAVQQGQVRMRDDAADYARMLGYSRAQAMTDLLIAGSSYEDALGATHPLPGPPLAATAATEIAARAPRPRPTVIDAASERVTPPPAKPPAPPSTPPPEEPPAAGVPPPPPPPESAGRPAKAANIRLDKYQVADDVARFMADTATENEQFLQHRRFVIPDTEAVRKALEEVKVGRDLIEGLVPGSTVNEETMLALRFALGRAAEPAMAQWKALRARMAAGETIPDAEVEHYRERLTGYAELMRAVSGVYAEWGRTGRALRMQVPGSSDADLLSAIIRRIGGDKLEQELAEQIQAINPSDPVQVANLLERATQRAKEIGYGTSRAQVGQLPLSIGLDLGSPPPPVPRTTPTAEQATTIQEWVNAQLARPVYEPLPVSTAGMGAQMRLEEGVQPPSEAGLLLDWLRQRARASDLAYLKALEQRKWAGLDQLSVRKAREAVEQELAARGYTGQEAGIPQRVTEGVGARRQETVRGVQATLPFLDPVTGQRVLQDVTAQERQTQRAIDTALKTTEQVRYWSMLGGAGGTRDAVANSLWLAARSLVTFAQAGIEAAARVPRQQRTAFLHQARMASAIETDTLQRAGGRLLAALASGEPVRVEQPGPLIPGKKGLPFELGTRLRVAADATIYTLATERGINEVAYREAERALGLPVVGGAPLTRRSTFTDPVTGQQANAYTQRVADLKAAISYRLQAKRTGRPVERPQPGPSAPFGADIDALAADAERIAQDMIFQGPLGAAGTVLAQAMGQAPLVRALVPFWRTNAKLFTDAVTMHPLTGLPGVAIDVVRGVVGEGSGPYAPWRKATMEEAAARGMPVPNEPRTTNVVRMPSPGHPLTRTSTAAVPVASERLAYAAAGLVTAGLGAVLASQGIITDAGPKDPQKQRRWRREGNAPYSFHIPGTDTNIWLGAGLTLGPLMPSLYAGAAAVHAVQRGEEAPPEEYWQTIASTFATSQVGLIGESLNVFRPVQQLLDALYRRDSAGLGKLLLRTGLSFEPGASAVLQWNRVFDDTVREPETALHELLLRVPFGARYVPPGLTEYGQIQRYQPTETGVGALSPVRKTTTQTADPVQAEDRRLEAAGFPEARLAGEAPDVLGSGAGKHKLTPKEQRRYVLQAGPAIYAARQALLASEGYGRLQDTAKAKVWQRVAEVERTQVADRLRQDLQLAPAGIGVFEHAAATTAAEDAVLGRAAAKVEAYGQGRSRERPTAEEFALARRAERKNPEWERLQRTMQREVQRATQATPVPAGR